MNRNIKIILNLCLLITFASALIAQEADTVRIEVDAGFLEGSLLLPENTENLPVALIIAGSGPTDRDGNNLMMRNNSLKLLAEGLAENGIASLRYDKRGIGKSLSAGMKEIDLRFDHYVNDVKLWIEFLQKSEKFSHIFVIGHSEGSLLGMIAAQPYDIGGFISLAGAGDAASQIIKRQLAAQPPKVLEEALPLIAKLENGETIDSIPPVLISLFRPSVQPYIINWFKYNPQEEITKLSIPVQIIQGTTDIQITKEDSDKLFQAKPDSDYQLIEGMNHVLKDAPPGRAEQLKTYYQPDIPLKDGLIETIAGFIKSNSNR